MPDEKEVASPIATPFSVAGIPIWIAYATKHPTPRVAQTQQASGASSDAGDATDADSDPSEPAPTQKPNLVKLVVKLLFIGLSSPFLELRDPVHGLIGLVILFVGLRIAYSMTGARPLEVDGPYPATT